MTARPCILIADDDAAIRTVVSQALQRAGYDVRAAGNATTLWKWVEEGEGDLVITDVVMPDANIFEILPRITRARPGLPVMVMSAQNTFMTALRASEHGAFEYLPKPFDLKRLVTLVGSALASGHEESKRVGRSPAMQEVYRMLGQMIDSELTQANAPAPAGKDVDAAVATIIKAHMEGEGGLAPGLYHRVLREIEPPLIRAALAATQGTQLRAAELLGLNRNTLRKKMRDLEME